MLYHKKRPDLKRDSIGNYKTGDIINVEDRYEIQVDYGEYSAPLCTKVLDLRSFKYLDCTPGIGWPYYIADFIHSL